MQVLENIAGVTPIRDSGKSILSDSGKKSSFKKNIQFYVKLYIKFKKSNAYLNGNQAHMHKKELLFAVHLCNIKNP